MVTLGNTRSVDTKSTRLCEILQEELQVSGSSFSLHAEDGRGCAQSISGYDDNCLRRHFFRGRRWKAYERGATMLSLYTALTFYGFGVVRDIHDV